METMIIDTPAQWDVDMSRHNGHLLQSWIWGNLKNNFGWTPRRVRVNGAAAQILFKRLPLGQTIAYVPKGPLVDWCSTAQCQEIILTIHAEAKKQRAIFLKIEPDVWSLPQTGDGSNCAAALLSFLRQTNFTPADTIQPQTTIIIDISGSEDEILAAMKQKTRYNIRLAKRKGVTVRPGTADDIPTFHNLSRQTSARDGFGIHGLNYYQTVYRLFAPNRCALLLAEFKGQPLAALMVFKQGQNAYYFYGASANIHRNLMPTYLLQWEAIRWARQQGCTRYDLWGIPNADVDTLEAEFTRKTDGLWGVYRFKRGFGGQVIKSVGAFDYIYNPLLYKLYRLYRKRQQVP